MSTQPPTAAEDAPLDNFSHCHDGILKQLIAMDTLPDLAAAALRARDQADAVLYFFRNVVINHHEEEERILFDAVLSSASEGEEYALVKGIANRLTHEHREVEKQFARLEPELKKMAKGHACAIDAAAVHELVQKYRAHAEFEETEFLPLSHAILSRNSNHMAALGLSLHMRHVTLPLSPS